MYRIILVTVLLLFYYPITGQGKSIDQVVLLLTTKTAKKIYARELSYGMGE